LRSYLKWLYPGMHVKRWLVLLLFGITFIALGVAYFLTNVYRTQPFPEWTYYVTLQFIPRAVRGLLFVLIGVGTIGTALVQLNRSLLSPFRTGAHQRGLVDLIYEHRYLARGPKVVAIGGGHGLSTLLRGLKQYTGNLTAVVTVADDGGSSGRLRREMGVLPPGDLRMCLVALADAEPLMTDLFQYRFDRGTGLEGHSFGNLFLVAMQAITGDFEHALRESSRVLAVRGQILPSTLEDIQLNAEYSDGQTAHGESAVPESRKPITRIFLNPSNPPAYPEAIKAILEADMIVIGPGSLYTSILPNLLVDDIVRAVRATSAVKAYVCNVATQPGETDEFGVTEHIRAIERHCGAGLFRYALVNNNQRTTGDIGEDSRLVELDGARQALDYEFFEADVVDVGHPHFHDPVKLAEALMRLYYDRGTVRTETVPGDPTTLVGAR
jgi:uncharacterized cofD-like protein